MMSGTLDIWIERGGEEIQGVEKGEGKRESYR